MIINLNDIKLTPDIESVSRVRMTDEEYFSKKYADFISNSRLKLINPEQNGSPEQYKTGFTGETNMSFALGSAVHELFLQPKLFTLGPDLCKPSAKLGLVIDLIKNLRKINYSIYNSIIEACNKIHYYENNLTEFRLRTIIKLGLKYYWESKDIDENNVILLSKQDRVTVNNCITNLNKNKRAFNLINPKDLFGNPIVSYNEEAFFINIFSEYNDKKGVLKLKMKVDNWSIDLDNKIITLNDLKTTGHSINYFMEESFIKFNYSRQFGMYLWILLQYCKKEYGYNSEEWTVNCNVIVVETTHNNNVGTFVINKKYLEQGRQEFCKLIKMVAYCEFEGYSNDIIFE